LVCIDRAKNTLFEKRVGKGIWQNLYQFPLIETEKSLSVEEFDLLNLENGILNATKFDYALYNEVDKVHKLSHQHLYTKFWIIEVDELTKEAIPISTIRNYPAPVLISDFIQDFTF
jgi:A/G-specific adenine glycosylase